MNKNITGISDKVNSSHQTFNMRQNEKDPSNFLPPRVNPIKEISSYKCDLF